MRKFNQVYYRCRQIGHTPEAYKDNLPCEIKLEKYNYIPNLSKEFVSELAKTRSILTDLQKENINVLILPVSKKEAYGVSFALLYRLYLKSKGHNFFPIRNYIQFAKNP